MSALWTSDAIAAATGGTASAPFEASSVTFDSREVVPGSLFIALKGEATDGHRFVDQALAAGAAGVLVSDTVAGPHVRVADTMAALEALGIAARARTSARIFGVTGSVGKTGTKEALADALARLSPGAVHRSVKSYNNHTGVPLSLARMPADSAHGVFEMGMNHAGELAALTRFVRPHVALVTTIAPAHIEFFGTEERIADAKAEIFEGLEAPDGGRGGTAIVPFDSPHHSRLAEAAARHAGEVMSFGRGEGADYRAVEVVRTEAGGSFVSARLPGARELHFTISQPGDHWVTNALAVLAAVDAVGGDLERAALGLAEMGGLPGRGARFMAAVAGGGAALVIDESYNANPASMRATLKVLAGEDAARRIAVLGEMRELGSEAPRFHAELAEPLAAAGVDYALLVGDAMAALAKALEGRIEFVHVPDAARARDHLMTVLRDRDAVLVKGSNGVGLARVVAALAGRD